MRKQYGLIQPNSLQINNFITMHHMKIIIIKVNEWFIDDKWLVLYLIVNLHNINLRWLPLNTLHEERGNGGKIVAAE